MWRPYPASPLAVPVRPPHGTIGARGGLAGKAEPRPPALLLCSERSQKLTLGGALERPRNELVTCGGHIRPTRWRLQSGHCMGRLRARGGLAGKGKPRTSLRPHDILCSERSQKLTLGGGSGEAAKRAGYVWRPYPANLLAVPVQPLHGTIESSWRSHR